MSKLWSKNGVASRFALGVAAGLVAQAIRASWTWLRAPATAGPRGQHTPGARP